MSIETFLNRNRPVLSAGVTLAGLLFGSLAGAHAHAQSSSPSTVARPGILVDGIPVGGKDREEVRDLLAEYAARLTAMPIRVRVGKLAEATSLEKLGGSAGVDKAVAAVFDSSTAQPGIFDRIRERFMKAEPRVVPLVLELTPDEVSQALQKLAIKAGVDSKNARKTTIGGVLKDIPPQPGKELNAPELADRILTTFGQAGARAPIASSLEQPGDRKSWLIRQKPIEFEARLRDAQPVIGLEQLQDITHTLTTFRTSLAGSSRNRLHNIALACKAIDGLVLLPGQVFSYNSTVGPRVPSAGFKEAPVIIRGKLEPGTGGGICQVSSTLYNAALLADMQIVRRMHHAIPVKYVPAGRDATVVDGVIDFRFKNRLEYPIALDAKVTGRSLVVKIHGHPEDDRDVTLVSGPLTYVAAGVKTVEDPNLPIGKRVTTEKAQSGRRVALTRVVRRDGKVIREEVVSQDYYRPFPGVIRVGTADPLKPAVPGTEAEKPSIPAAPAATPGTATPAPSPAGATPGVPVPPRADG